MRTDYKDFIASTENRHYRQVNNDDGTISLVDETVYTQEGDKVSAGVLNELSQNAIWPLQHTKSGTTHQLTGLTAVSGVVSCVFTATADFAAGDTVTVDGEEYAAQMPDGESAPDKLFTSGVSVSVVVDKTGKKVNFKSAGGVKLPAGTFVIYKIFFQTLSSDQSYQNFSGTFTVPISGTYRITVIGKGGSGGTPHDVGSTNYSGAGGGAGGAAQSILSLSAGAEYEVTVNNNLSSFGNLMTSSCGKDPPFPYEGSTPGAGGIASGGNVFNYAGNAGQPSRTSTGTNFVGVMGGQWSESNAFLGVENLINRGQQNANIRGLPCFQATSDGFMPFGIGGGGAGFSAGKFAAGGLGQSGAVIIELFLKGVNDT